MPAYGEPGRIEVATLAGVTRTAIQGLADAGFVMLRPLVWAIRTPTWKEVATRYGFRLRPLVGAMRTPTPPEIPPCLACCDPS